MAYPSSEFVKEADLPVIGVQCPKCKQGFIVTHQFYSKKKELFTGVKCDTCNYSWIKSNWDDKVEPAGGLGSAELNYKALSMRIDKMATYLTTEIEPYIKSIYKAMVDTDEKKATKELNDDISKEARENL